MMSEEPAPCPTSSTSDERPLGNRIFHDSRTPSPSILNLPATPPQISYETEDVPKSAENPHKNSPHLEISEVKLKTITMPSTAESVVFPTVFTSHIIPVASTSRDTSITVTPITFSLETLRLLPKAPLRKGSQTNRRKVKSAILTVTPVKIELAAIEAARTARKKVKQPHFEETKTRKRSKPGPKTKKMKVAKKLKGNEDSEEEEESFCLCCFEPYSNSRAKEKWEQCLEYKNWAHEACTARELSYVCHNCLSD